MSEEFASDWQNEEGDIFIDVGAKVNRVIDNVITGITGFVVGVQKLSNQLSKTYNVVKVKEIPVIRILGKVTEAVNIVYNFNEFRQGARANWWNGVEAMGQTAFWIFGGAEANLIYNLSTMRINLTIDAVDYFKSN